MSRKKKKNNAAAENAAVKSENTQRRRLPLSKGTPRQKTTFVLVMASAAILAELLISNFSALGILFSGVEEKELDIGSDILYVGRDNSADIGGIDAPMKNICITLGGEYLTYEDVTVSFTDDNFRYDDAFSYNKATMLMSSGFDSRNFMSLSSYGEVGTLRVSCDSPIEITGITLNTVPDLRFSLIRFCMLYAALLCIGFGFWRIPMTGKNDRGVLLLGTLLCGIVLAAAGLISNACADPLLVTLPDDVSHQDQYMQLFDAFHKGQLNLDIDYDTSRFDVLENPFDRSERNEHNLHGVFWDRAYHDGKLYSYFGAAPVFTVYYPIYLITRHVPSALFVSAILAVHCIIFLTLLYRLFLRRFCREVPLLLALLGLAALVFGSTVLAIASEAQFYFIAVLSGIASTAAFLYFLFEAYYSKKFGKRIALLTAAGVSIALIAASRPTMLLYCFIGIIPAVFIFKDNKETAKNKALYVTSIGVPVIIGAALIMTYNFKRFGNPFEFGFNYQLTVSRAQANTIKLSLLPAAVYHYFFQQPSVKSSFPYIGLENRALDSYTRYSYTGRTMGILTYPLTWAAALLPITLRKADKMKLLVMTSLPAAGFVMSFIDMCKAGSHYRYTADIAFAFLLVALIAVFDLLPMLKGKEHIYKTAYIFAVCAMMCTIVIGTLLVFANEGATMLYDYVYATELLRRM